MGSSKLANESLKGVNIKLISSVHIFINQDRSLWIYFHCILYIPLQSFLDSISQFEGRLPSKLDDDALWPLLLDYIQHILNGGARISHSPESKGGVTAAVVKLNALPNAVGAAAQDQHLGLVCGHGLAFPIIRAVHVGQAVKQHEPGGSLAVGQYTTAKQVAIQREQL
ncbi:MAG: hypothetical protein FRX49_03241 [Trebouxia sp. A1-2]|nr:MAG: hypothetical protein FRX49_03241 [Trebouxia sp. A1-2]